MRRVTMKNGDDHNVQEIGRDYGANKLASGNAQNLKKVANRGFGTGIDWNFGNAERIQKTEGFEHQHGMGSARE